MLAEFAHGRDEKAAALKASYEASDWNNYAIDVHALKSTSRMIGAATLSEIAARLEQAANSGDTAAILAEHDDMLARYNTAVMAIAKTTRYSSSAPRAATMRSWSSRPGRRSKASAGREYSSGDSSAVHSAVRMAFHMVQTSDFKRPVRNL